MIFLWKQTKQERPRRHRTGSDLQTKKTYGRYIPAVLIDIGSRGENTCPSETFKKILPESYQTVKCTIASYTLHLPRPPTSSNYQAQGFSSAISNAGEEDVEDTRSGGADGSETERIEFEGFASRGNISYWGRLWLLSKSRSLTSCLWIHLQAPVTTTQQCFIPVPRKIPRTAQAGIKWFMLSDVSTALKNVRVRAEHMR